IWAFAGFRGMIEIWPAILVAGVAFAVPQFLISNFHGPWLVDVVAAATSIAALALFLKFWQPKKIRREFSTGGGSDQVGGAELTVSRTVKSFRPWIPWIILSVVVFIWVLPQTKPFLDGIVFPKIPIYGLHKLVPRVPPVVAQPAAKTAVFNFNFL